MFNAFTKTGLDILHKVGDSIVAAIDEDEGIEHGNQTELDAKENSAQRAESERFGTDEDGTEDDGDAIHFQHSHQGRKPASLESTLPSNIDICPQAVADSELESVNLSHDSDDRSGHDVHDDHTHISSQTLEQVSPPQAPPQGVAFNSNKETEDRVQIKYRNSIENELTVYETKIKQLEREKVRSAETIKMLSSKLDSWRTTTGGSPTAGSISSSRLANIAVKSPGKDNPIISQLSHELSLSREKLRKESHINTTLQDAIKSFEAKYEASVADNMTLQSRIEAKNAEIKSLKTLVESSQTLRNTLTQGQQENEKRQMDLQAREIMKLSEKLKNECVLTKRLSERMKEYENMVRKSHAMEISRLRAKIENSHGSNVGKEVDAEGIHVVEIERLTKDLHNSEEAYKACAASLQQAEEAMQNSQNETSALLSERASGQEVVAKLRAENLEETRKVEFLQSAESAMQMELRNTEERLRMALEEKQRMETSRPATIDDVDSAVMTEMYAKVVQALYQLRRGFESKIEPLESSVNSDYQIKDKSQFEAAFNSEVSILSHYANALQDSQMLSSTVKAENCELSSRVVQCNQQMSSLQQELHEAKDEIHLKKQELDSARVSSVAWKQEKDEYLSEWKSAIEELKDVKDSMRSQSSNNTSDTALLHTLREQVTAMHRELGDKNAEMEAAKADLIIVRQDLMLRDTENRNLQEAIGHLERERDLLASRTSAGLQGKTKEFEEELHTKIDHANEVWAAKLHAQEEVVRLTEQKRQDEEILRRKAELEFTEEKRRMQRTLENALKQLENSQRDVVDRELITNLIVSYFKRNKSDDVLDLISKILTFTDEQKQVVGLVARPGAFIESIFSSIGVAPPAPPEVEGDNLAELWVNFLMSEAEKGEQEAALSQPPSPRKPMDHYSSENFVDDSAADSTIILSKGIETPIKPVSPPSVGSNGHVDLAKKPTSLLIQPIVSRNLSTASSVYIDPIQSAEGIKTLTAVASVDGTACQRGDCNSDISDSQASVTAIIPSVTPSDEEPAPSAIL